MTTDGQGNEQWKQKYYDQLDRLEQKEADWGKLEATLKRTIGRLSLAAEGQHKGLDKNIDELRTAIKNNINRQRLDVVVDDISRVITQLEDQKTAPNRFAIDLLEQLVSQLKLPRNCEKQQKKLIKQFAKADDEQRDNLLKETIDLLKKAVSVDSSSANTNSGFLDRIFNSDKSKQTDENIAPHNIQSIATVLEHILSTLPWPATIKEKSTTAIALIKQSDSEENLHTNLEQIQSLINEWSTSNTRDNTKSDNASDNLSIYKNCFINLLNNLDNPDSPSGQLTAFKISVRDAKQEGELDDLSAQLSQMLVAQTQSQNTNPLNIQNTDNPVRDGALQPSIQELLIRLLEQLIVPPDLQNEADKMKQRLEKDANPADWKKLLKDVALLINSIRSRMQKEKHEFETFLQQVTDRLKTMDQFLQSETKILKTAQSKGEEFDKTININVSNIRQDVDQATELINLKNNVNTKLDNISSHIVDYREYEITRVEESQQQVYNMQTRMLSLEKEADSLKQIVIEKNKQEF